MSTQITVFAGGDLDISAVVVDDAGSAVDVSGATIEFNVIPKEGGTAVIDLDETSDPTQITGDASGNINALLSASDMALDEGTYLAQFKITDGSGNVQYVPDGGNYIIIIVKDSVFT